LQQAGIEEMVRAYNDQFGLDKPLWVQYLTYVSNAFRLDFGYSITDYPARVLPMIMHALPWTMGLLLTATLLAFLVGTLLAALVACSWLPDRADDRALVDPVLPPRARVGLPARRADPGLPALRRVCDRGDPRLKPADDPRHLPPLAAPGALDRDSRDRVLVAGDARHDGHDHGRGLHDLR